VNTGATGPIGAQGVAGSATNTGATGPTGYGTYLTAAVSTISAGSANKVMGPGMVFNSVGSQNFGLYDSFGNQINSGLFQNAWPLNMNETMFVPGNIFVASYTTTFLWIKYT
jgi:hypothetical protein